MRRMTGRRATVTSETLSFPSSCLGLIVVCGHGWGGWRWWRWRYDNDVVVAVVAVVVVVAVTAVSMLVVGVVVVGVVGGGGGGVVELCGGNVARSRCSCARSLQCPNPTLLLLLRLLLLGRAADPHLVLRPSQTCVRACVRACLPCVRAICYVPDTATTVQGPTTGVKAHDGLCLTH
jgi:hypothetical protein